MKHLGMILMAVAGAAMAADATFDASNNVLTVPSLVVGSQRVSDVQVRLKTFDLISVGATTTVTNSLPTTCTDANASSANLAAVKALIVTDPTKNGLPPSHGYQTIDIDKATSVIGCQPSMTTAPFGEYGPGSYQKNWLSSESNKGILITNTNSIVTVSGWGGI